MTCRLKGNVRWTMYCNALWSAPNETAEWDNYQLLRNKSMLTDEYVELYSLLYAYSCAKSSKVIQELVIWGQKCAEKSR